MYTYLYIRIYIQVYRYVYIEVHGRTIRGRTTYMEVQ